MTLYDDYKRLLCLEDVYIECEDFTGVAYAKDEYYRGMQLDDGDWEVHSNSDRASGLGWIFTQEDFASTFKICK